MFVYVLLGGPPPPAARLATLLDAVDFVQNALHVPSVVVEDVDADRRACAQHRRREAVEAEVVPNLRKTLLLTTSVFA